MKLKTVSVEGQEYAAIQDGKPVYVQEDGKEIAFDAPHTVETLNRTRGEATGRRKAIEALEQQVKQFEGIDPDQAREAIKLVENYDDKKKVDAGEVERIKENLIKSMTDKYAPLEKQVEELRAQLYQEKIGGSFARSMYIEEELVIPPDIAMSYFGNAFKIEDGEMVAYDRHGNKIYSPSRPGEVADFEEAIGFLVDQYPQKDRIKKGTQASGGGIKNNPSNNAPDKPPEKFTESERTALFHSDREQFNKYFGAN